MKDDLTHKRENTSGVSRRDFMKISGVGVALPLVLGPKMVEAAGTEVAVYGPGKVPIALTVNGKKLTAELEPRVTLLDALRDTFNLTGAKRVCDRGTCGACTVLLEDKPVYACMVLAIDAQGKKITTVEGLAEGDALTPVMQAFVDHDAQQCGFCTPGFVVATTHFLQNHPEPESNQLRRVLEPPLKPTAEEIRRGLSGNFCRCGTYEGIRAAVLNGATGGGVPGNGDPFAYTCTADKAEKVVSDYQWPDPRTCRLLGKYISRVDGPIKSSGRAKYTYDYNPAGLLAGRILRCPYAHARITSIDTSAAEKMPGVKAVQIIQKPGTEIFWAGDEVVGVAAVDESTAEDALRAIKVQYEQLPHFVSDAEPPKNIASSGGPISQDDFEDMEDNQVPDEQVIAAIKQNGISFHPDEKYLKDEQESGVDKKVIEALRTAKYAPATASKSPYKKTAVQTQGEPDKAFASAAAVVEGLYGASCITHCCLETHGMAAEWPSDKDLLVHVSTQNLSGIAPQVSEPLGIPAGSIQVLQQYIGGGFGSKFSPDRWGIASAQLSKAAGGKPVKIMLERDSEQEVAGMRPSGFGRVKIAADKDGKLVAWESALVGNRRSRWRRLASTAVHLRNSQPAQAAHCHFHQSGKRPCVASAEPSAGCGHHHDGDRRSRSQDEHGSGRVHHAQSAADGTT